MSLSLEIAFHESPSAWMKAAFASPCSSPTNITIDANAIANPCDLMSPFPTLRGPFFGA